MTLASCFSWTCIIALCISNVQSIYEMSNTSRSAAILTSSDNPAIWTEETGPWSSLLENWAIGSNGDHRQERIMKLPNTSGYYISNRVDTTAAPPTVWSQEYNPPASPPGKIVNHHRPAQYNNYPNKKPNSAQLNNSPSRKEVSETDLYLLGAIEKLVYRVDFMEKRLKKAEELIYYLMSGNNKNPEPCPKNFTRAGMNCYHFGNTKEQNWKLASDVCKGMGATLAEMESIEENQDVVSYIQANAPLRGKDFWTGGLNPGLLWIWSNSARPVTTGDKDESQIINNAANQKDPMNIKGNGRCLKLAYNPSLRTYSYLGFDCAGRQHYICEILDKSLSNHIQRISKELKLD